MSDDEYAIRTIAAEAGGPEDAQAIAHVINNRRQAGRWGDSYRDVVTAPKQFEPWTDPSGQNYPMNFTPDSSRMRFASEALNAVKGGAEDVTGGAQHFYAPKAQEALAKSAGDRGVLPSWMPRDADYTDFGPTRVVRGVDAGTPRGVRAFAADQPQGEAQKSIGAALKAGSGPEADTFLGGIKAGLPTQKDSSGKESTNWEKVLIPLLSGVGSALASTRNTLGGALGEGLLGGVGGYQSISKMQADIPKTEAETQQLKSESARIDLLSRQLAAGLWERVPVAGVGFVLINKEDPTIQFTLTDKDFKPLPQIAGRLNDFGLTLEELAKYRKTGELPVGTRIVDNKPAGSEQKTAGTSEKSNGTVEKVTDAIKPAKNFMEWTAVTEPPKNFMPPEQIPRALNKSTQASDMAEGQKASADATSAAASSYKGAITLTRLMDDYSRLPQNGPLAPGAYADARYKKLGEINMALTAMGLPAIDTGSQAASEAITKGNFALAAEMSRSIGTRVSNSIVDQAIQNNPSLKNSPLGFQLVAQSLKELQNYDQDREKYINSYFGRFQHTRTANSDFNDINKPEFYAKRAANTAMTNFLLSNPKIGSQTVDGRAAIDSLKAHIAKNPEEKDAAKRRFDKTLGVNGAANMLLGEF
jgi:hypothetical protein